MALSECFEIEEAAYLRVSWRALPVRCKPIRLPVFVMERYTCSDGYVKKLWYSSSSGVESL